MTDQHTSPTQIAIQLANHPLNDLERVEIGQQLIPHILPGENVDTCALRLLAEEVETYRQMMHDVVSGKIPSKISKILTQILGFDCRRGIK